LRTRTITHILPVNFSRYSEVDQQHIQEIRAAIRQE
jgi:hypothetical protein